jgi:hypothetical protein
MENEIEIHILKDGTQMITAMVAGRPIAMTSFEWQLLCHDVLGVIETHLTQHALDAATVAPKCTTEKLCPVHNVWHAAPPRK